MIRRLREQPDCLYSHLVNKARDAIFRYRGKGSSVDGLPYQRGRARQYEIISLEELIDNEAGSFEEKASLSKVLSDPTQPRRLTEERACTNILSDCLRAHLSAAKNQILTLRLMDVPWREVGQLLDQGAREMARMRRKIVETAQIFGVFLFLIVPVLDGLLTTRMRLGKLVLHKTF